ncbi:MAG: hypothetical protein K2X43_05540 [Hyphomonadaceae bacterium]|jgi:hypothetical protein|nr:hypothetical protein [Hyphomonadaceae bacterium]
MAHLLVDVKQNRAPRVPQAGSAIGWRRDIGENPLIGVTNTGKISAEAFGGKSGERESLVSFRSQSSFSACCKIGELRDRDTSVPSLTLGSGFDGFA